MRFGLWAATAAAVLCAGQASAARYYEFQFVSAFETTGYEPGPTGVRTYPIGHTDTLTFAFDTANATPAYPGGPYIFNSNFPGNSFPNYATYGIVMEIFGDPSRASLGVVNSPGGPQFNTSFAFSDIPNSTTFQTIPLSSYAFSYDLITSPRRYDEQSKPGRIISATAFTTDVAPATLGVTDSLLVTYLPEPATWAMMIIGFGLVGATLRRRRAAYRHAVTFA